MHQRLGSEWLRLVGVVLFWAMLGGALDVLFVRDVEFASPALAVRYAAVSGLLWSALCLPTALPLAWLASRLFRGAPRPWDVARMGAHLAAIVLPWTLVLLLKMHKVLPVSIPVSSPGGLARTSAILLLAVVLWVAGAALLTRRLSSGRRAREPLAPAGWILLLAGVALLASSGSPAPEARSERPNLLLISIDSLRRDIFEEYLAHHASATLREFVDTSRFYGNAHTTYSHSLPSHASMFTGLYPPDHGALVRRKAGDRLGSPIAWNVRTVATRLASEGYETVAILANAWIGFPFGLETGFETYVNYGIVRRIGHFDSSMALSVSVLGPYLRYLDAHYLRTVHPNARLFLRWLASRDPTRPFFAFLHFIEMHTPSDPPRHLRERFCGGRFGHLDGPEVLRMMQDGELSAGDMPEIRAHLRRLHLADLAQMDEFLAPVLEGLRKGSWLENTLVFLVSDHGENLYEKAGTYGKSHVYHTSSEVPFVLHVPGEDRGSKRPELTSLVDVAATLLAAAGVSVPGELSGRDLLSGPARGPDEWIFLQGWDVANGDSARAVLFGDGRKWIRDGSGQDELYDLPSDPRERRDLLPSSEVRGQGYGPRFESIIETLEQNPSQPLDPTKLPESVARRLRALGYVK